MNLDNFFTCENSLLFELKSLGFPNICFLHNTFTNVCKYTNTLFFYLFNRKKEPKITLFLIINLLLLFSKKNFRKKEQNAKSEAVPPDRAPRSQPFSPSPSTSYPLIRCDIEVRPSTSSTSSTCGEECPFHAIPSCPSSNKKIITPWPLCKRGGGTHLF